MTSSPISIALRPANSMPRYISIILGTGLLPILVLSMVIFFGLSEPRFLEPTNLLNISRQSVYLLLIAMGQMIVLVNAQLDLSVGATIALISVVTALITSEMGGSSPFILVAALGIGLLMGVAVGFINGFLVAVLKVPSFMATLGTTSILLGAALILSKGAPVTGVPPILNEVLGVGSVIGVPLPVWVGLFFVGLVYLLLNKTTTGRAFYAVGGNESAANVAGIPVRRVIFWAFISCSLLASVAGVLLTARVGSGEASLGASYVMLSIAAPVLGGTSLFGGEGKLWTVVLGVIFLGILSNGMNLMHISSYVQELILGIVLVAAVALDRLRSKAG